MPVNDVDRLRQSKKRRNLIYHMVIGHSDTVQIVFECTTGRELFLHRDIELVLVEVNLVLRLLVDGRGRLNH